MHRLLRGNRGRPAEGAAMIEQVRHRAMGSAGEWRSGRHLLASKALAWAERPPLWESDDVSAMRNYRYRHRDSPCVAKRSGGTNIPGRTTVGGRRRTSRSAVARKACVRDAAAVRGQRRHRRAGVGFFHPHPPAVAAQSTAAGRKGGPISSASGSSSSLCWSWGRRAGRRAVGLHARGGARSTGRAGQRGGVRRGVKPNCAAWVMIRAAG